ncbi:MAG TPA: hypothetical protein VJR47_19130 [Stellaceae bacterium]|nr:hypothetical protein [Stellaceae bacterium]
MMHEIDVLSDDELAGVSGRMMAQHIEAPPTPPAPGGGASQDMDFSRWWDIWNSLAHTLY